MLENTLLVLIVVIMPLCLIFAIRYFKKWDKETFIEDESEK
jgi:hypothetical protein